MTTDTEHITRAVKSQIPAKARKPRQKGAYLLYPGTERRRKFKAACVHSDTTMAQATLEFWDRMILWHKQQLEEEHK